MAFWELYAPIPIEKYLFELQQNKISCYICRTIMIFIIKIAYICKNINLT